VSSVVDKKVLAGDCRWAAPTRSSCRSIAISARRLRSGWSS